MKKAWWADTLIAVYDSEFKEAAPLFKYSSLLVKLYLEFRLKKKGVLK